MEDTGLKMAEYDKWADDIFNSALKKAQEKGFYLNISESPYEKEIHSRIDEATDLKTSVNEIQTSLKKEISDLKKKMVQKELEEKPREIKNLEVGKKRLETELEHLKIKLAKKQAEIEEKERLFSQLLKEKLEEKEKDLNKQKELEHINLTEKINISNVEMENYRGQLKQGQTELERKEKELSGADETLKKEREHWTRAVSLKETEINDLRNYLTQKEQEVEKKGKEITELEFRIAEKSGEAKEKEIQLLSTKEHLEKELAFLNNLLDDEKSAIIKAGMIKREARLKAEGYKKEKEIELLRQQFGNLSKNWAERQKNSEEEIKRLRYDISEKEKKIGFLEDNLDREMHVRRSREEEKLMIKSQLILGEAELQAKYITRQQDLLAIKVSLERERQELKRRMEEERIYWQNRMTQVSSDDVEMKKRISAIQKDYDRISQKVLVYEKELILEKERHKAQEQLRENQLKEILQKKMQQIDEHQTKWDVERIEALKQELEEENKELKRITERE